MALFIFLGIVSVAAIFATLVQFARDGYGQIPTRPQSLDNAPRHHAAH